MRMRLGLLQDPAAIDRQIAREVKEAEAKRKAHKAIVPTVPSKEETEREAQIRKKEEEEAKKHVKEKNKPKIRPLSEAKAIESGANFISEGFLFAVAVGIILFESWRSNRKEQNRRDMVADRLEALESENKTIKAELEKVEAELHQAQQAKAEGGPISRALRGAFTGRHNEKHPAKVPTENPNIPLSEAVHVEKPQTVEQIPQQGSAAPNTPSNAA